MNGRNMEIQFNFDVEFQTRIIQLMVIDVDFGKKCSNYLEKQYFSNKYMGFFFDVISKSYTDYGYCNEMILENEVYKFDKDKSEPYAQVLEKIKMDDERRSDVKRSSKYLREKLEPFIKKAIAYQINEKLVKNQNKDPDRILKVVQTDIEKIQTLSMKENNFMTLKESFKIMEDSEEDTKKLLPLGIPELDEVMNGGIPRGVLTLALGGTNVGKSIFLINAAYNFIKQGYRVLYLNLEGEQKEPMLRIISRATQIPFGRILSNNLTEKETERVSAMVEKYSELLRIKHVGDFRYTIEDVFTMCSDLYQEFPFDVFICDYGQILGTKERFNSIRERMIYVHRGLASIGNVHDAAVLTVAQGTRDAQQKNNSGDQLLRMNDISECFEIVRAAAVILTLNRSEADEQSERVRFLLEKQRKGKKGVLVNCKTDMSFIGYYGPEDEGLGFLDREEVEVSQTDISDIPMAQ